MSILELQFHLMNRQILRNYYQNLNECETVEVTDINSVLEAVNLISSTWFKSEVIALDNIQILNLKINEKLDENAIDKLRNVKFSKKSSIVITFESTVGKLVSKILWKVLKDENMKFFDGFMNSKSKVIEFCKKFLVKEIKNGQSGILQCFQSKTSFQLHQLGSADNCNLLMIAVKENNSDIVQNLLQQGYHVDSEDNNGYNAIDHAWNNFSKKDVSSVENAKSNIIIMSLLNANSKVPRYSFDYKKASKEVRVFIDFCEDLHKISNSNKLADKIKEQPNIHHFYDRNNKSLMSSIHDSEHIHEDVKKQLNFGIHEEIGSDSYILRLKSCVKLSATDANSQAYFKKIDEVFEIINSNHTCSKILKVAATWKNLKLFFDFKYPTSCFMDPSKNKCCNNSNSTSNVIYIGAKDLMNETKKFHVISVLIHELCHVALQVTFMNDSKPYQIGFSPSKNRFETTVVSECERNKNSEEMIRNVFEFSPKEYLHAELIAVVPQMMMKYFVLNLQDASLNSRILAEFRHKFKQLRDYFKDYIERKISEVLTALAKLQDENEDIQFEILAKSMKAKLAYGIIVFQGVETSFHDCLGDDSEVLKLLSSNDYKDLLIRNKKIQISNICKESSKSEFIRRKFIKLSVDNQSVDTDNKNYKNYMQIKMEIKNAKFLLLADISKATRTATFEDLAVKLKQSYKNFWVSIIKIKNCLNVLEEFRRKNVTMNVQHSSEFFSRLLNLNSNIESLIFKKMFTINKVVLLIDGIDDAGPENFEFMVKVMLIVKIETKNQYCLSFHLHNAKRLEDILKVDAYKSVITIYTKERRSVIEDALKSMKFTNPNERFERAQEVLAIIESIEAKLCHSCVIDYKLMIQIITELYLDKKITSDSQLFIIFSAIFEKQINNVDKIATNPFKMTEVYKYYQTLALKSAKINDLNIENPQVKTCESDKPKWTIQKLLSYGLLVIDPDDKDSFDFSHKIYSDFLLSRLILSNLFNLDLDTKDDELQKNFKILVTIENDNTFKIARMILMDYMRNIKTPLPPKAKTLVIKEALGMLKDNFSKLKLRSLEFWSIFLRFDKGSLSILWQVNEKVNLMRKFLIGDLLNRSDDFVKFIELAEYFFGSEWNETFNKSGKKMISDEEIKNFEDDDKKINKNFMKLINYADENFSIDDLRTLYDKLFQLKIFNFIDVKILNEILLKIPNIYKKDKVSAFSKFVEFYAIKPSNEDGMMFFCENIENLLKYDEESIRAVLFHNYRQDVHPLVIAIKSDKVVNFLNYKNLYKKYKTSWVELQDILILHSVIFRDISFIRTEIYPEFEAFFMKIFESDMNRLEEYVLRHFRNVGTKVLVRKDSLGYMMNLMMFIFGESKFNEEKIESKFTTYNDFIM